MKAAKRTTPANAMSKITEALNGNVEPKQKTKKRSLLARILTNRLTWLALLAVILSVVAVILYLLRDIPSPRSLTSTENYSVSTQIFDRNGKLLYEIFADEHRIPVSLASLPPHVYQSAISIEDKHFYSHFGFDIVGIARAFSNNLKGQRVEGGSTITQQLVKNALLTNERSITRKAKEAVLAVLTEALYSKDEILEMYLNYISYGGTAVGIEAASQQYFDKPAADLTLAQASLLAGLPQAPSRYSPFASDTQAAKNRQKDVLRRMVEDGFISQEQSDTAQAEVLKFALSKTDIEAPHFVFYVRDQLYAKYGVDTVEKGGLRVYTTLDLDLHNTVQASVSAEVATLERQRVGNGAALVLKPNTGEILSMVGSKDYFDQGGDGQVNVVLSNRQPGSSIKPIMYASAFQQKLLNPGSMLLDIPTCFLVAGQKPYCPRNYDGSFKGPVSIRTSLGNSLNIPAVKGLQIVGLQSFIDQATKMGITTWKNADNYGLSLTLGGGEVRMIDLAQAFSVIANEGVKVPVTSILKIEDYQGKVLEETNIEERKADLAALNTYDDESGQGDLTRVMDRAPAYLTAHIMQDNTARTGAFGPRSQLVIPDQVVSAKTGTTNDLKDNWTVGFTPEFLVISWVGNNDGSPMNQSLVSGITGAAPIFNDIMSFILQGLEPVWQEKPADVLSGNVCITGMPPQEGESCQFRGTELYWAESKPSVAKVRTEDVWVRPETGLPPQEGESTDGLEIQNKTFYEDAVSGNYCTDCTRRTGEDGKIIYEQYNVSTNQTTTTEQE
ncbi:MAG: penicillin-binding protein [bacterium]|nr:penicillin-binding protein [bacterium]